MMERQKCDKQIDGKPCVRFVHTDGVCVSEGKWCVKHDNWTVSAGFCPPCELGRVDDLVQKVDKLFAQHADQVIELRAMLKAAAQAQNEWKDQAGEKLTARIKDFAKRIDNVRDQLNDLAGWSVNAERKLDGLTEPLGESFRRIIGQRLAHLAKRIWVDLPF